MPRTAIASSRCRECRRRRIKCDKNWPECSSCLQRGVACSGRPDEFTFIQVERRNRAEPDGPIWGSHGRPRSARRRSIVHVASRGAGGGASYGYMRLSPNPRSPPSLPADRTASLLARQLTDDNLGPIINSVGYTSHLVPRLEGSKALLDVVALFTSTWANFQRGDAAEDLYDPTLHTAALRSLQNAIDEPEECFRSETLAAATLLDRLEFMFEPSRAPWKAVHLSGIKALMVARGPPDIEDTLEAHLLLENHMNMALNGVMQDEDNFFLETSWMESLERAIQKGVKDPQNAQANSHVLGLKNAFWPGLARDMRRFHKCRDSIERRSMALDLQQRVQDMKTDFETTSLPIIEGTRADGHISEQEDDHFWLGCRLMFSGYQAYRLLATHIKLSIVFNRMLSDLTEFLELHDSALDAEMEDLRHLGLKCMPYVKDLGEIECNLAAPLLVMSCCDGAPFERDMVVAHLVERAQYIGMLPKDTRGMEEVIDHWQHTMLGRCRAGEVDL